MHSFRLKKVLVFALVICSGNVLKAQTSTSSNPNSQRENNPYSKYGIGEMWNGNNTLLKGMGNITSAFQDPFTINSDNPASYSSLSLTTFEGGGVASKRTITNSTGASYSTGTASLAHLTLGIPVGKTAGFSLGLRPYSKVYYALVDTIATAMGQTMRSYAGDGGLSYAYIGGAYKYKGLSVGVNFGYMFGNFRNFTSVINIDTLAINRAYEAQFAHYNNIGGIYWKGGLIYERKFSDSEMMFRVGATWSMSQQLTEKSSFYQVAIHNFSDTLVNDTNYSESEKKGKLTMPGSYSVGVALAKSDKWMFGIDYTSTNWGDFNSTPDTTRNSGLATSTYKVAIGGQITPNAADINSYFPRVTYRAGFYYGTENIRLQNTATTTYGITFGGSFPFKRNIRTVSRVHASFDIGKMGTTANNLLQQTYIRFGFGFTFNEKWFIPRKYD